MPGRRTVDLAASTATIGPLDFKKIDAAVEAGRLATQAMLEAQPHLLGVTADPQVANMI
ncbi:hypothetical protein [Mycobacterium stomatepiae]|uniref:Uncharacterized protein n=1 Tax=Mycobacterium stomatepiae TaxID=470076 RepID=A0A7I7Q404_9MYCO|nr:hypothetical protein [Mycobacterium stomatepiae]MCV7165860.1 hypothetical protein [Mycobacterium stomatepiae]BBY20736.1 hypothetical protein MSTO_09410 [Mycobacterium stomatepiae]